MVQVNLFSPSRRSDTNLQTIGNEKLACQSGIRTENRFGMHIKDAASYRPALHLYVGQTGRLVPNSHSKVKALWLSTTSHCMGRRRIRIKDGFTESHWDEPCIPLLRDVE